MLRTAIAAALSYCAKRLPRLPTPFYHNLSQAIARRGGVLRTGARRGSRHGLAQPGIVGMVVESLYHVARARQKKPAPWDPRKTPPRGPLPAPCRGLPRPDWAPGLGRPSLGET